MAAVKNITTPTEGYSKFTNEILIVEDDECEDDKPKPKRELDIPNVLGSTHSLTNSENSLEMLNPVDSDCSPEQSWEMNYHEAAIFLEEGENNEKFDSHPKNALALPAYLLVHNRWYHGLDISASIFLLLLAFVEEPSVPFLNIPVGVHGTIELLCLLIIGTELALKLRWMGWRTLLSHKRTMLKCCTLIVMVLEAFVVLVRQNAHLRVTRALRPIFLIDTRFCGGVRRFIRQILQSVPPILDMLALLLLFVFVYSLVGYFLFNQDKYFKTLPDSFISLFILLTTANFPDVMMPSYARSKWNAIFFISYLCVVLYVLMNLMLAVVYETFTRIELDKFRKLLLHKRQACQHAFKLLVTRQQPRKISFKRFRGLMSYFAPRKSSRDTLLMFKYMDTANVGDLTLENFYQFYDANMLLWCPQISQVPWYHMAWPPLQNVCQTANNFVSWIYFDYIIYLFIFLNLLAMIIRALQFEENNPIDSARLFCADWDSILFLALFAVEALLKVLAMGITRYFDSGWNMFDFVVTFFGLLGILTLVIFPKFTFVVVFRPLRLIRLFKMKKRYRDIFGTVVILSPLMCSAAIVMLVMFYFFAIIGMELFAQYDMRDCCINSTVEDYYKTNGSSVGYYYLNTFENILTSGVTLFELTVVNNWFIVMNGYVSVAHPLSRIYFIVFYLFTMVVLTIVVASVLQAFRFRIHYKRHTSKQDEEKMLHEEVHIDWEDVQKVIDDQHMWESIKSDFIVGGTTTFIGRRPRNREVLQRRMYRREIEEWMGEEDAKWQVNDEEDASADHLIRQGSINHRPTFSKIQ